MIVGRRRCIRIGNVDDNENWEELDSDLDCMRMTLGPRRQVARRLAFGLASRIRLFAWGRAHWWFVGNDEAMAAGSIFLRP